MLEKKSSPTNFDSYGRYITRESDMNHCKTTTHNCKAVGNCDYGLPNFPVQIPPMSVESIKYNRCDCDKSPVNPNLSDCSNHALYFKYHNVRIRYVGFIFHEINYIADLDNRIIFYKPLKETCYRQLPSKVSTSTNSLTNSYRLSFPLYKSHSCAEVEVYPKDIEHCSVTISDSISHEKLILPDEYTTFEFFDMKNMLDENGNLITLVDYKEVLDLTESELLMLYTFPEMVKLIKNILDNLSNEKDLTVVIKNLLVEMKRKLIENTGCGCNHNDTECSCSHHDILDEDFPIHNCGCGCNHPSTPIIPPAEDPFKIEDLYGKYLSECGELLIILPDGKYTSSNIQDTSTLEWKITYSLNMDGTIGKPIITLYEDLNVRTALAYMNKSLRNIYNAKNVYQKDTPYMPSIDVSINDYKFFLDGDINAFDDITIKNDTDLKKEVSIELEKGFSDLIIKNLLSISLNENNSIIKNITLTVNTLKAQYVNNELLKNIKDGKIIVNISDELLNEGFITTILDENNLEVPVRAVPSILTITCLKKLDYNSNVVSECEYTITFI